MNDDGIQGPCPSNRPFSGQWPSNVRCYFDVDGKLHHWAAMHQVEATIDNFWMGPKHKKEDRIIVGYTALLQQQRQYNEWVPQNPAYKPVKPGTESSFAGPGGSYDRPASLPETGRLTMGTLLIPFYKSYLSYSSMHATFLVNCAAAEGDGGDRDHPCMKYRQDADFNRSKWVPNYPNEAMATWGRSLESLEQTRQALYERVAALAVIKKDAVWDPLDCFGARDRRDCSIEALAPADAAALDALTRDVADRMQRVREIEDARANAQPAPIKSAAAVEWIGISGGRFQMGNDDERGVSAPRHEVDVPAFEMSKALITIEQYAECVRAGQCDEPDTDTPYGFECNWGKENRERHPVNCVDWAQANQYARYQGARLPSEAEYEYAASSGRGLIYPWGDSRATTDTVPTPVSNAYVHHDGRSAPVCSKPLGNTENALCDMTGNISAWMADRYEYTYTGAPANGSARNDKDLMEDVAVPRATLRAANGGNLPGRTLLQGTPGISGPLKAIRGIEIGSLGIGGKSFKNTYRSFAVSVDRYGWVGFRLVRSPR